MSMETKIENGKLIISIDLDEVGSPSKSNKSMVHATTGGNITTKTMVNGKPLVIGFSAYTKNVKS